MSWTETVREYQLRFNVDVLTDQDNSFGEELLKQYEQEQEAMYKKIGQDGFVRAI